MQFSKERKVSENCSINLKLIFSYQTLSLEMGSISMCT